jgi:hypothetical protein
MCWVLDPEIEGNHCVLMKDHKDPADHFFESARTVVARSLAERLALRGKKVTYVDFDDVLAEAGRKELERLDLLKGDE